MSDQKPFEAVRDYGQQHMGWPEVADEQPVDHVKAAVRLLDATTERYPYDPSEDVFSPTNGFPKDSRDLRTERREEALVHATLAVAEQQRIANIIAFQGVTGESYRAEVRAALGLKS